MNKVQLTGNLGALPEFKSLQSGDEIALMTLATDTFEKDEDGLLKKITDWHRITVYNQRIIEWLKDKISNDIVKKGTEFKVVGRLSYLKMIDKYHQEKKIAHIILDDKEGDLNLSSIDSTHHFH